jgi:hypothetical protein
MKFMEGEMSSRCIGHAGNYCGIAWILFLLITATVAESLAGPPFDTDDPEPVDYLHWEFYLASVQHFQKSQSDATLPHIEINFGAAQNLQLHIVAPMGYVHTSDATHYGYSDTEIGVKYRLIEETDNSPQVGIFPLLEIPTGNQDKDLGHGKAQFFLPVWFQKSWGSFTTYGGGGYWFNPGTDSQNYVFAGWEAQYDFSKVLTLGGEVYYHSADSPSARSEGAFNLGGYINFNEHNHLLFSIGRSFVNGGATTGYLGYQVTI